MNADDNLGDSANNYREIFKKWSVKEDETLAQNLQNIEFYDHFNQNRYERKLIASDITKAKALQDKEKIFFNNTITDYDPKNYNTKQYYNLSDIQNNAANISDVVYKGQIDLEKEDYLELWNEFCNETTKFGKSESTIGEDAGVIN